MKKLERTVSLTRSLLGARPLVVAVVGLALLGAQAAFAQNSRPGQVPVAKAAVPSDVTLRKTSSIDVELSDYVRQTDQALALGRAPRRSR